jgi:hypothetical protein
MGLPEGVAVSMEEALARGTYRIRAGRYVDEHGVCPLAAADEVAGSPLENLDAIENYGGRLLRFAVAFDLNSAEVGLDAAIEVVKSALAKRHA